MSHFIILTHFFFYLGYAKVYFHLPYRQTKEGITQGHAKGKVPSIPDFTTICKKKNKQIKSSNKDTDDDKSTLKMNTLIIVIDSTGIKVTNRGLNGCREKWHIKK